MEKLVIEGGQKLRGEISVSGSKNATLPVLAATLLTDKPCVIHNVPRLRDTLTMIKLLRSLGKSAVLEGDKVIVSKPTTSYVADYKLVSTMRGSFCVFGPLLAKFRQASVSLPGGCVIGIRPVDLHIKGVMGLGAKIHVESGYVHAKANKLKGTYIYLGGTFGSSVLATANVMMAATLASGVTIIDSAACEPEVVDLGNFLNAMGAEVMGHGTPQITVRGVKSLHGAEYKIGPDRIEAGTYVLMAAATKSDITIKNLNPTHIMALLHHVQEAGVSYKQKGHTVKITSRKNLKPVSLTTYPYPGFPTDLQAQFMALMATTPGVSVITEKVFPDRFIHIAELNRMGAKIRREGYSAIIEGVKSLYGAP